MILDDNIKDIVAIIIVSYNSHFGTGTVSRKNGGGLNELDGSTTDQNHGIRILKYRKNQKI